MTHGKLLIIDDDEIFAASLSRRLQKQGFTCIHARDVSEALLKARKIMPDYALLDMKLEKNSGLSLIKPLKVIHSELRIVLLTGYASIASAVDAIKLGADEYLSKPIDSNTVVAALLNKKNITHQSPLSVLVDEASLSADQAEWEHIQQALKFNSGNISATARQLGMHRRTLQRKLQKKPPQPN